MSKKTLSRIIIFLGVLLGLAVVMGGGFFILKSQGLIGAKSTDAGIPARSPSTMVVHLTDPKSETRINAGVIMPIYGQMTSNYPVASLELWVNGDMVEEHKPPQGTEKNYFLALWNWKAPEAGIYKLILRGVDQDGRSSNSNMVVVFVEGEVDPLTGQQIQPTPDPASLVAVPSPTPGGPLDGQAGAPPSGVNPPPPSEPPPNPPPPPNPEPEGVGTEEPGEDGGSTLGEPPKDPSIDLLIRIESEGCTLTFKLADQKHNATGFFIERSGPDDMDFTAIAMVKAESSYAYYVDNSPLQKGTYLYNIIAYNAETGVQVNKQKKVILEDNACNKTWNGVVFADIKLVPKEPLNEIYCYARLNDLPWERMPVAEGSSIPAMSADELSLWNTNLNFLTEELDLPVDYNFTSAYDLTPFAPDLSQAGVDSFDFTIKCMDFRGPLGLMFLGTATKVIDMKDVGQLIQLSADRFDVFIYFSSKVMSGNQPGYNLNIARPFNLQASVNAQDCPPEIQSLCEQAVLNDTVIFKWEWKAQPCDYNPSDLGEEVCVDNPSGFRLFRLDYPSVDGMGGIPLEKYSDDHYYYLMPYPKEAIVVDANDSDVERQSKQALMQRLFMVRAVYANAETGHDIESYDSNWVQLKEYADQFEPKKVLLNPIEIGHYRWGYDSNGESYPNFPKDLSNPENYVDVGFENWASEESYGWSIDQGYWRYDLSDLVGKHILSATLKFNKMKETGFVCYQDGSCFGRKNCAQVLTAPYVDYPPGVQMKWEYPSTYITHSFLDAEMDVTYQVQLWTDGTEPNYGFMLATEQTYATNKDTWSQAECRSEYGPVQLEIEYDSP